MRLIDADALWKDATTRIEEYCDIADLMDIIKRQPTIEPERNGKWLLVEYPDGYYHAVCSECGQWADEDVYLKGKWNFCPNCGAEMRQDDPSHPFADSVMMKGKEDETVN